MSRDGLGSAEQLAQLVTALTEDDRTDGLHDGLVRIGCALSADVTAAVTEDRVLAAVGPVTLATYDALRDMVAQRPDVADLPGIGSCSVIVLPWEGVQTPAHIVAARRDGIWTSDEHDLLRAMTRVLALKSRAAHSLAALEERQRLLERLTRIQRSITSRAPLPEVLQAIVSGAHELFGDEIVAVRRVCSDDPQSAEVLASSGVDPASELNGRIQIGQGAGGRAILEDCLVVMNSYATDRASLRQFAHAGLQAAMAAPVRESGRTMGSLVVASAQPGRTYSETEQEMLQSFADHASIALTDARTVESLRQALYDARHDAMHDVLTGLPNRALLRDRLAHATLRAARHGARVALVFVDLDGFKHVNDSLGHDAGDQLLVEVGRRFVAVVRDADTVARLGGDEFAVLIEDIADIGDVTDVAERLLEALVEPVTVDGRDVGVGGSIGIAMSSDDVSDPRTLLRNADVAMYAAKRSGGAKHVVFAQDMHEATARRLTVEQELRDAVAHGELELHYQPIVDVATGHAVAFEALVRWRHPERGLVAPSEFIHVAESTRLIKALGEWVLRTACVEAARWPDHVKVAVNVSPRQVDARLLPLVEDVLRESGLPGRRLKIEVTEGVAMADSFETIAVIEELHAAGVGIAIDDFGTGYSSLARLRALPVDVLKVDRQFTADLDTPRGIALMSAIVGLCRGAGLIAVAEGVETPEQLARLRELGCAQAQGYLLGRPAPAADVPGMLTRLLVPVPRRELSGAVPTVVAP